ncbi:glycoside hydrolase family 75 protein [Microscilla marina]|uniref:glycoside hydrolase family 75 protein n=1 Tax=Microscilla marina TaxID=1027 RepID=UPI000A2F7DDD|nr:glycoside hydrolase family 75 protein [Microscilla marina]
MSSLRFTLLFHFITLSGWLVSCTEATTSSQPKQQTDTLEATPYGKLYLRSNQPLVNLLPNVPDILPDVGIATFPKQKKRAMIRLPFANNTSLRKLLVIDKKTVWQIQPCQALLFGSGMSIDADGSPRAYHPKNTGIDDLKHAGKGGKWWAIATKNGKPVVQKSGYYVSMTSLQDFRYAPWDQRRYVNAETIPYIVLPPKVKQSGRVKLGDVAVVYNTRNKRWAYAIYADTGANTRIGEGSIALARLLGVNANARTGGVANGIIYVVFPGSGQGKPMMYSTIRSIGKPLFDQLGGARGLLSLSKGILTP